MGILDFFRPKKPVARPAETEADILEAKRGALESIIRIELLGSTDPEGYGDRLAGELDQGRTVQDCYFTAFQRNSAGRYWGTQWSAERMLPLVEAAREDSLSASLDYDRNCMCHLRNAVDSWARRQGTDECRELLARLREMDPELRPAVFFDVVLASWSTMATWTMTFRALTDVVDASVGWPDGQASRDALRKALSEAGLGRGDYPGPGEGGDRDRPRG